MIKKTWTMNTISMNHSLHITMIWKNIPKQMNIMKYPSSKTLLYFPQILRVPDFGEMSELNFKI